MQSKIEGEKEMNELATVTPMQLTKANLNEMAEQRAIFKVFVGDQLKQNIDYGLLPGTDKPSLWKPGAEKIANIFQLGSRIIERDRKADLEKNFAMFSYTVEVFHIPTGRAIAQCEGICNSQEKKYKDRSVWEWDDKVKKKVNKGIQPTPVGDILNTLAKMAQKRAYVGAVIIATKASDFFDHDLSEDEEEFFETNPYQAPKNPPIPPKVEKERAKFETKAQVNAEAKGEFDNFKASQVSGPIPNDERKMLGAQMLEEKRRLGWSNEVLNKFVTDNLGGKLPAQLDLNEFKLLVETMKRQVRK